MSSQIHDLSASLRTRSGSGLLGQMRREGLTPANYYGKGVDNLNIKVKTKDLFDLLHHAASEHLLVNLDLGKEGSHMALIHDVQHEPLTGEILHVDFLAVKRGQTMKALVPLVLVGVAENKGVKAGGVLNQQLNELAVITLPKDLPETIEVDVKDMEIGDSFYISQLVMPEGVEVDVEETVVLAHVSPPTIISDEEEGAEEGAAAEPEVISEKQKEEDED